MRSLLKEVGGWEAFQELRDAYRKLGGVTPTKPEDLPRCDQAMAKLAREYEKFGLTPQEVALYAALVNLITLIILHEIPSDVYYERREKMRENLKFQLNIGIRSPFNFYPPQVP